jgi:hypothetical protein
MLVGTSYVRAGEIKAQFEDRSKITIQVAFDPMMSTESFRKKLLSRLAQNKIDCGPKCIPKSVGNGIWECCDGRRIPPTGKVLLTVTDPEFRSVVKNAFAKSMRESNPW